MLTPESSAKIKQVFFHLFFLFCIFEPHPYPAVLRNIPKCAGGSYDVRDTWSWLHTKQAGSLTIILFFSFKLIFLRITGPLSTVTYGYTLQNPRSYVQCLFVHFFLERAGGEWHEPINCHGTHGGEGDDEADKLGKQ